MAFDFPDLFAAIARHVQVHVPGLKQVSYPAPSRITGTPAVIVISGSDSTAGWDVTHEGPGEQMWTGQAAIQMLVSRENDIAKEGALSDRMVFPMVDAFSIDRDGMGVELLTVNQHIDRCLLIHHNTNLGMKYGGQNYVGIEFHLDIKFHRVWDTE